ncbi:MAG: FAD-dependent thymidylate synthase [Simkaniaceae bacterium]|nr:FAD-dependent thymidylate synthase [Simkaniaceae bacterium]
MLEHYEDFNESQLEIIKHYVTNTASSVFALRNLPEVIKGALFSKYSRSSLGLRSLLLKDFILNEATSFATIAGEDRSASQEDQSVAIQKAQNFYDRILDGYGDDSIGELGGAHLAIENISMLGAKIVEDCRIGGSPLEKSTRYIYFDQKVNGEYLFYKEPVLMTSAYRDLYLEICGELFETYGKLIPPLTELIEKGFPKDPEISKVAYAAALRAKVLDCLRGLLPASALTNMGVYGNGRFFETLLQKLNGHNLGEMQEIGSQGYTELSKVIPSFIRRAEPTHKHQITFSSFHERMHQEIDSVGLRHKVKTSSNGEAGVKLINFDAESPVKIAAALLFEGSNCSLKSLQDYCHRLSKEEIARVLDAGASSRENRRHKSPRALENAEFTFEIVADFGVYRDLQRHRTLTQERQKLSCGLGYYIPEEILGTEMEDEYRSVLDKAKSAYDTIALELPEEAQYIVPMAYNMRWYFHINLRALQWLTELRSSPAGHPTYRYIAQAMAKQVSETFPEFERFFKFVDFDGYALGRLGQEERKLAKMSGKS